MCSGPYPAIAHGSPWEDSKRIKAHVILHVWSRKNSCGYKVSKVVLLVHMTWYENKG